MTFSNKSDATNLILRVGVPILGCTAAGIATAHIMQEGNPLAAFCFFLFVIFFCTAVVNPSAGLLLLLLLSAYSDLVKRLLILFGDLSFEQVGYVLAGAPVVVGGLFTAMATRAAFHQLQIKRRDLLLLAGVAGAMAVSLMLARRAGMDPLEAAKYAANNGFYMLLMPIGLTIVESPKRIGIFLRQMRFVFIPVACYGIYQAICGLADFEIDYLRSGLTIMEKELYDVRPRAFSTMNAASTFGAMSAMLAIISLYPLLGGQEKKPGLREKTVSVSLAILYLAATFASVARASIVVWLIGMFALWCFATVKRTRAFYISMISVYTLILVNAPYILEHLEEWDPGTNAQSEFAGQVLRAGTYSDRLYGFINLARSGEMWSLFGLPEDHKQLETTRNHDPLSTILVDVGVVGLAVVLAALFAGLRFVHTRYLRLPLGFERSTALLLIATNSGLLGGHLLFSSLLGAFPLNLFFWLFNGMIGYLLLRPVADSSRVPAPEGAPAWAAEVPRRAGTVTPVAAQRPLSAWQRPLSDTSLGRLRD